MDNLEATHGTHLSDPFTVPCQLDGEGNLVGTYYAVLSSKEDTQTAKDLNRDWQQRLAMQDIQTQTKLTVDLDVDSDNDDWTAWPDRSEAEENVETTAPGKVVMLNEDDDEFQPGMPFAPDNGDAQVNGWADEEDMGKMVADISPSWDTNVIEVVLEASNYNVARVFGGLDPYPLLLGPEAGFNQPRILQPEDLWGGLLVEGVQLGQVTFTLIYRRVTDGAEIHRDEVLVTLANTLTDPGLDLPFFDQHKDTEMLCVDHPAWQNFECPTLGGHRWDNDHGAYWVGCGHCEMYCTRASVRMVNVYYGGDLTQDRVSYQSRFDNPFQNGDLGHDEGLWPDDPLAWALGLQLADIEVTNNLGNGDAEWHQILNYLVSYRPVIMVIWTPAGSLHSIVIGGFQTAAGGLRQLHRLDPANLAGPIWDPFVNFNIRQICAPSSNAVWNINAGLDEASVSTHTDADWVVDFDEDEPRFADFEAWAGYQLDRNLTDSGGGPANDKQELDAYYH